MTRIVLVGCVATKSRYPAPARELYTSPLFTKRRAYAEATGCDWAILSALHGVLQPDEIVAPYNLELKRAGIADWSSRVRIGLLAWLPAPTLASATLEVHAGVHYVDGLVRVCRWLDHFGAGAPALEAPLRGLGIGRQLDWYSGHPPLTQI